MYALLPYPLLHRLTCQRPRPLPHLLCTYRRTYCCAQCCTYCHAHRCTRANDCSWTYHCNSTLRAADAQLKTCTDSRRYLASHVYAHAYNAPGLSSTARRSASHMQSVASTVTTPIACEVARRHYRNVSHVGPRRHPLPTVQRLPTPTKQPTRSYAITSL